MLCWFVFVFFVFFLFLICKYFRRKKITRKVLGQRAIKLQIVVIRHCMIPTNRTTAESTKEKQKNTHKKNTKMRLCCSAASSAPHQKKIKYLSCSLNGPPSLRPFLHFSLFPHFYNLLDVVGAAQMWDDQRCDFTIKAWHAQSRAAACIY